MKFKTIDDFRKHIKALSDQDLDSLGAQLEAQFKKTRSASLKLGRGIMIDECYCEVQLRKTRSVEPVDLDELVRELSA